jgi:hypothetical protein
VKSSTYSQGQIIKVHRDQDGRYFCFVLLTDGKQIFLHEGRHHLLEAMPDGDVIFDPRNREDRYGRFRWSIKPPEEGDRVISVVFPATRSHHRDFAHYWAYWRDWFEFVIAEGDRRAMAQMRDMDAAALEEYETSVYRNDTWLNP